MFENMKNLFKSSGSSRCRILVVEDNELERQFLKRTLEKDGYRVMLAENGQIGFDKATQGEFDLFLLDCEMPVMGGVELCKRLKQNEKTYKIPLIFLTGLDTPKNIIDCFEGDCENYLSKPISGKLLVTEIKRILHEHSLTSK